MKRIIALMLSLLLLACGCFLLSACDDSSTENNNNANLGDGGKAPSGAGYGLPESSERLIDSFSIKNELEVGQGNPDSISVGDTSVGVNVVFNGYLCYSSGDKTSQKLLYSKELVATPDSDVVYVGMSYDIRETNLESEYRAAAKKDLQNKNILAELIKEAHGVNDADFISQVDTLCAGINIDSLYNRLNFSQKINGDRISVGKDLIPIADPNKIPEYSMQLFGESMNENPYIYDMLDLSDFVYKNNDFNLVPKLEALREAGFTIAREYVLIDETFFELLENGVSVECEKKTIDGNVHKYKVKYELAENAKFRIRLDLANTSSSSVPLEYYFENGGFKFDFSLALGRYDTTTNSYVDDIIPCTVYSPNDLLGLKLSDDVIINTLPEFIRKYAATEDLTSRDIIIRGRVEIPDKIEASGTSSVATKDFLDACKNISFKFTYGDRVTYLKADNEDFASLYKKLLNTGYSSGSAYGSLISSDWGTGTIFEYNRFTPSTTPYVFEADCDGVISTVTWVFTEYIHGVEIDTSKVQTEYFIGDDLSVTPHNATLKYFEYLVSGKDNDLSALSERNIEVNDTHFNGFDSSAEGTYTMTFVYGSISQNISYTVNKDIVESIRVNTGCLDVYIIGAPVDVFGDTMTVTYKSGRVFDDVVILPEYVSELPTQQGLGNVRVTYEGVSITHELVALEVKSVTYYSGLSPIYIVDEKPTEIILKVVFEENTFNYDYDYIVVGNDVISAFDTAVAGNKSWVYIYAGHTVSVDYTVVDELYLGYTIVGDTITINGIYTDSESLENYLVLNSASDIVIPSEIDGIAVTKIGASAFAGMNMIKTISLPDSISEIGNGAFKNMPALKKINIPSVATLGTGILNGCTALEELTISGDRMYKEYFSLTSPSYPTNITVIIKEGAVALVEDFFMGVDGSSFTIKKLVIPTTLTSLGYEDANISLIPYRFTKVEVFEVVEGGYFTIVDGVIFRDNGKELYYYPMTKTDAVYTIPSTVTIVTFMAHNPNITEITVPSSVTSLGSGVFKFNEKLVKVVFEGSLSAIPDSCFSMCESLTTVQLPTDLVSIGENAFEYTAVEILVFKDGLTTIGQNAFYMAKIKYLAIPSSAMQSFMQLQNQYMRYLTDFAYDGSVAIMDIPAIYGMFDKSPITNIYIYGVSSFESGITYRLYSTINVYIDADIRTITYDYYEDSGAIFHYEGSSGSISNQSSGTVKIKEYNSNFSHWYE